jgi:aspartyl protease family protein
MSVPEVPWQPEPPPPPPPPVGAGRALLRLLLLLLLLGAVAGGAWLVAGPAAWRAIERPWAIVGGLILLLFVVRVAVSRRPLATVLAQILLWFVLIGGVALGYGYRDEVSVVADRLVGALVPSHGRVVGPRSVAFPAAEDGQYWVDATVDGVAIHFLVDTGATGVVLNRRDARRLGFDPARLVYSERFETANGRTMGAPVTLGEIRIGPIVVERVGASVNDGDMPQSLLGMRYLARLANIRIEGGTLTLTQ